MRLPTRTSSDDDRPTSVGRDPAVTGPHAGLDRYGRLDHRYYRCERCGLESTDPALARGCWRCRDASEEEEKGA